MQKDTIKSQLIQAQAFTGRKNGRMVAVVFHKDPGVYIASLVTEESGFSRLAPQVLCLSLSEANTVAEAWLERGEKIEL